MTDPPEIRRVFRCGPAARWLPRLLAGAVLAAALLVAQRIDPLSEVYGSRAFRIALAVAGAAAALWIIRLGGELRASIEVASDGLVWTAGERRLRFDEIESIGYAPPFSASRTWLPAAVLADRKGRVWRMPALLDHGDDLIALLVRRSGREDLGAWAEAFRLRQRMAATARRIAIGYATAGAVLLIGIAYYLH